MGRWLWFGWLLDPFINKEKELQNIKSNQLAHDSESQERFLEDQDTEMWVSKDALSKYPTMWWRPTKLIGIFTLFWIAYWAKEGVEYFILNPIDKGTQQEEIMNDTQENLQNTFVLDSTTIIDYYKETLSADEIEEFEQFWKEKQRELATDNDK